MAAAKGMRLTSALFLASSSLARRWTHPVTSVSAGPPLGGVYLKPPSSGGVECGGVVLEAAILRRVVRGRDDDAVCPGRLPAAVVDEDGPRDDGGRRDAAIALDDGVDAVRRQHLEGGTLGGLGQGVGVLAHVERPLDAVAAPVVADGLRDRRDVGLGEGAVERRAPVSAGAEADELGRIARVRLPLVVLA